MPELYPDDQKKVDEVLKKGPYKVDRQPFRMWGLLAVIIGVLGVLTAVAYVVALNHGVV